MAPPSSGKPEEVLDCLSIEKKNIADSQSVSRAGTILCVSSLQVQGLALRQSYLLQQSPGQVLIRWQSLPLRDY